MSLKPRPCTDGRYRAIFNSAADGILVANRWNRFVEANAAAADFLGIPRDEILMQHCNKVFLSPDPSHVCFLRNVLFRGETVRDIDEAVLTRGGERKRVLVSVSPLIEQGGEISGIVYILRDIASMKRIDYELRRQAATDELTGLLNRRELSRGLETEVARARRHERPFSVLMVDLDGFKEYNDANGHLAGDVALKSVGRLLATDSRQEDIVARYGGEEFVIVLPEIEPEQAIAKAERIRAEIASWPFPGGKITASIGVLNWQRASPMKARDILRHVDEALYEAKRTGKNRVATCGPLK